MARDEFSARLSEDPNDIYLENLRRPLFETLVEHLFEPLLVCNRSHATMLAETGLIADQTAVEIFQALDEIEADGPEQLADYRNYECPYFEMEDRINDLADTRTSGELHMGRSRNDLYAAAVRIATREKILDVFEDLLDLRSVLQARARRSVDVVMPGFTHGQPAQPITLAHYLLAFDHLLDRDCDRIRRAYDITNRSPLGAAALGGTGFSIDRDRVAELTGFDGLCHNTYDAVASMDYLPQVTNALALSMVNLSRVSTDLVQWMTFEFGYMELHDGFATVSSIMPQKKNPVVLETTRTRASDVIGAANSTLIHLKAAPFGDVREVAKHAFGPLFETTDVARQSLRLMAGVIETLELNEDRMETDAENSFCTTTELADTLVRETDLNFREAHTIVGRTVREVSDRGGLATDIGPAELRAASEAVLGREVRLPEEELKAALTPETNVSRRSVTGGTAPERTEAEIEEAATSLRSQQEWHEDAVASLDRAADMRRQARAELE